MWKLLPFIPSDRSPELQNLSRCVWNSWSCVCIQYAYTVAKPHGFVVNTDLLSRPSNETRVAKPHGFVVNRLCDIRPALGPDCKTTWVRREQVSLCLITVMLTGCKTTWVRREPSDNVPPLSTRIVARPRGYVVNCLLSHYPAPRSRSCKTSWVRREPPDRLNNRGRSGRCKTSWVRRELSVPQLLPKHLSVAKPHGFVVNTVSVCRSRLSPSCKTTWVRRERINSPRLSCSHSCCKTTWVRRELLEMAC